MTYSPPFGVVPPMCSAFVPSAGGLMSEPLSSSAPASGAVESPIAYIPLILAGPCVVRRVWWANGATTTGGATIEVGVYSDSAFGPGTKLVSGSATQGTANNVQFVTVTATSIPRGRVWLGLACSTTTNTTLFRSLTNARYDLFQRLQETGTSLPATATAVETTNQGIWLIGFATTASP